MDAGRVSGVGFRPGVGHGTIGVGEAVEYEAGGDPAVGCMNSSGQGCFLTIKGSHEHFIFLLFICDRDLKVWT